MLITARCMPTLAHFHTNSSNWILTAARDILMYISFNIYNALAMPRGLFALFTCVNLRKKTYYNNSLLSSLVSVLSSRKWFFLLDRLCWYVLISLLIRLSNSFVAYIDCYKEKWVSSLSIDYILFALTIPLRNNFPTLN